MGTSSVTLPSQPPRTGQCYEDTQCSEIFALIVRLRGKDILQEVDSSLSSPHILMSAGRWIYLSGCTGWRWRVARCPVRAYKVSPVQIQPGYSARYSAQLYCNTV